MHKLRTLSASIRQTLAQAGGMPKPDAPGQLTVEAVSDDRVVLMIYGYIGEDWWADESLTAKSVVDQLKGMSPATIDVRINSIGGSVSDGIAIHNELRRHAKAGTRINVTVDGTACSIASLIAMSGDEIIMPATALMMLHAPWGTLWIDGNAKDIRESSEAFAKTLEAFGAAMAEAYARKTGRPASDYVAMWEGGEDHWFTAAEAKTARLCDVVIDVNESSPVEENAESSWLQNLTARAPEQHRAAIAAAVRIPAPQVSEPQAATSAASTEKESEMPQANKTADNPITTQDPNTAANALSAIQQRNATIKASAEPHLGNKAVREYYDSVIAAADPAVTAEAFNAEVLKLLAKGREPMGQVVSTDRDGLRDAMRDAINARAGSSKPVSGNPYNGMTLFEMARASVDAAGIDTRGVGRLEIVATAFTHTSSDFPGLLSSTASAALIKGYNEIELDIARIAGKMSLSDFKPTNPVGLGAFSDLDKVPESQEYSYGKFSGVNGLPLKLSTYGKLFSISRQAIINDDIGLLTDVPRKMGQAAKRTLIKDLFALLVSNPTMPDGKKLFHVDRGNLLAGAAISTASIDLMRVALGMQKDSDGNPIGVGLADLLTPLALGGLARQAKTSQFTIDAAAKNSTQPNYLQNLFDVIDTAYLAGTGWYGIADPNQREGLLVGYLDGNETPYLEQQQGFTVDGVAWKVRHDAGVGIGDPLALAYNPG